MFVLLALTPGCAQLGNHIGLITADVSSEDEKQDVAAKTDEAPPESKAEPEQSLDPEFPTPMRAAPRGAFMLSPNSSRAPSSSIPTAQEMEEELQAKILCMPKASDEAKPEAKVPEKLADAAPSVEALRERVEQEAKTESIAQSASEPSATVQASTEKQEQRAPAEEKAGSQTPPQAPTLDPQQFLLVVAASGMIFLCLAMVIRTLQDRAIRKMTEEFYRNR